MKSFAQPIFEVLLEIDFSKHSSLQLSSITPCVKLNIVQLTYKCVNNQKVYVSVSYALLY